VSETPASAFLIDIDGVVLKDDQALSGGRELVQWLLDSGRRFLFLTNYPSQTPGDLASRMAGSGIEVPTKHFFTSAMATAEFLDKQAGTRRRAFVVGEGDAFALRELLERGV
jgi:NagD protein